MFCSISKSSTDRAFYSWLVFVFQTYFLRPSPIGVHWPVLSMVCRHTNMIRQLSTLRTLRNEPFIWFVLWRYYKLVIGYTRDHFMMALFLWQTTYKRGLHPNPRDTRQLRALISNNYYDKLGQFLNSWRPIQWTMANEKGIVRHHF